ncbi:MAG: NAD-dependent epimerase/dehydratase family protein [Clostridia bacterium]
MKTVYLVTGAYGHLGNAVVKKLLENNCSVRAFAIESDKEKSVFGDTIETIFGDIRKIDDLEKLFVFDYQCEKIVIHLAGIVSIASKFNQDIYDVNVGGTKNVVALCKKYKVKKLVHISSVHAIPEPKNGGIITEVSHFDPNDVTGLYAKTKSEATQAVLDSVSCGLDASVIHPSGIFGPFDNGKGHLTQLVIDFMNGSLFASVKGGYDFVDVRDVADGIFACIEKGKKGECYILSNKYFEICEILRILHKITGKKDVKLVIPMWLAKFTAPLSEYYYKLKKQPPLYTAYSLYTLSSNAIFSHEKASKELGFSTRPMEDTLADTVSWILNKNHA